MENIKLISNVITDGSYISVNEDTDYPKSRLCDGDRNDLWMYTQTNQVFAFGISLPTNRYIDFVAFSRHNLGGETLTWKIGAVTVYTGSMPSLDCAFTTGSVYFDDSITLTFSPTTNPSCAEIVIGYQGFEKHPNFPGPVPSVLPTAEVSYTRSGHRWVVKKGEKKWSFSYEFTVDENDITFLEQFLEDIDYGIKPFYMYDHRGTLRYVESQWPISLPYVIPGTSEIPSYQNFQLEVVEVF